MAKSSWNLRFSHQVKKGGQHLGAATSLEISHKVARSRDIVRRGKQRLCREFFVTVTERENAKTVARPKPIQRLEQRFASLLDGGARHGTRHVDHVEHFYRHAFLGLHSRRKSSQQEVCFAGVVSRREEKSGLWLRAFRLLHF